MLPDQLAEPCITGSVETSLSDSSKLVQRTLTRAQVDALLTVRSSGAGTLHPVATLIRIALEPRCANNDMRRKSCYEVVLLAAE